MSNSNNDKVLIVEPELSINKKLGPIKFEQAFDGLTITKAETLVAKSEDLFKDETFKDFKNLKTAFAEIQNDKPTTENYKKLSEISFSIKSRAATGGYPLASEIANSMYKFCDAAAHKLPTDGYRALKLHFDSLIQVFEKNFAVDDSLKSTKLVNGLEEVARKFLSE